MNIKGISKGLFFCILTFMFVSSSVSAEGSSSKVTTHLKYGEFEVSSQVLTIDKSSRLRLEVKNNENSAGYLYYRVYQMKEFLDDEDNNKLVCYKDTVKQGSIDFYMDKEKGSRVHEFEVKPGRYRIELSTCLTFIPVFDTPTCEGEATLTSYS